MVRRLSFMLLVASTIVATCGLGRFAPTARGQTPQNRSLRPQRELVWAGDPEGGAPFVEADPSDPGRLAGFDVEIAALMAASLSRTPRFLNVNFASIDQSIDRGDADVGLSGIEDTPARRATLAPTIPYYEFREVLSVRDGDAGRFRRLADLRGHRVGTLGGTIAYEILLNAGREHGIDAVSYEDDVHPYSDLVLGRVDAVLLDNVLADRRRKAMTGFTVQPETVATGHYVGVLAARNAAVRDALKRALPSRFGMNGQAPVAAEHPDDVRVNHTRGAVEDHDLDSRGNIVPDSWEPFEQGNTSVCRGR